MNIATTILFGVLIVTVAGCGTSPMSAPTTSSSTTEPSQRAETIGRLPDIGEPDDAEREFDGIKISGSALTDDHIAAIMTLTDDTKPAHPNRYLIRGIEHTGPNTATNTWQTGHAQIYQTLRLVNGYWKIDEEGGGFGHW